jgi:hypothetical protein
MEYFPDDLGYWEHAPMTLQVALVGNDGFVIASDTKGTFYHPASYSDKTRKFLLSDEGRSIFCFSGNHLAYSVACRLQNANRPSVLKQDKFRDFLNEQAGDVFAKYRPKPVFGSPVVIGGFIEAGTYSLWSVTVSEEPVSSPIQTKFFAGDERSSALFFPALYYSDKFLRPVSELVFLASHSVLMGGTLNPSVVSGLDVAVAKEGKIAILPESEIALIQNRSEHLNEDIMSKLFNESKP